MSKQSPEEIRPTNETKEQNEAVEASKRTGAKIKNIETRKGTPINSRELTALDEKQEEEKQAAREALEELRSSTGEGWKIGERQAERGEYSEKFKALVEKNLEAIRQIKERKSLAKDFGEAFARKLKKEHPALLTNQERDILNLLAQESGKPGQGKIRILPFIESFKRRTQELKESETQPHEQPVKEVKNETPPEASKNLSISGTTPGGEPPINAEKVPQPEIRPETTRPEKELRDELFLHESIAREMEKIAERGRKVKEKLGISKTDLGEYFPVIAADIIRSYPSDSKEIARRLDLDSKLLLDMFEQRIELLASEKLPEEIKERIFEKQGVKGFEAFYRKIADQNGKLQSQEVLNILRGQFADIVEKKEMGIEQHLKEILRRQFELTKEYLLLRKFRLRQGEINQILGAVLSEREREPFKTQERGSYEATERLAKELPEDIRNKKPWDFFGGLRREGLQLKKALRSRLR